MRFLAAQVLLTVAALLLVASPAPARTWSIIKNCSGDAPTVQAGIDSAVAGDTVLVHPGTYLETIRIDGKGIAIPRPSPRSLSKRR